MGIGTFAWGIWLGLAACGGGTTAPSDPPPKDPAAGPTVSEASPELVKAKARKRGSGPRAKGRARGKEPSAAGKPSDGKWRRVDIPDPVGEVSEDEAAVMAQLEAIGYADGTREVAATRVITRWDHDKAHEGLNLWTSGHAPEAYLSTMDGAVLHTWTLPWSTAFPDEAAIEGGVGTHHFRRVHLTEDGGLYVIFEGKGMARIDKDSQVQWAVRNRAHHDVALLDNGHVLVLARSVGVNPEVHPKAAVVEDWVQELDENGEAVRSVNLREAMENSPFASIWLDRKRPLKERDLFHTNSLALLDGSLSTVQPAFQAGRVLVSMRHLDAIAVVDLDEETVVWAHQGAYRRQHDPSVTAAGQIMLFDNGGQRSAHSHVRVYDPATMDEVWTFSGSEAEPFRSATLGTAQLLPNGNVLATESDGGRAVEIAPDHSIVWEFYNPHRAGPDEGFIAALFEVVRLPPAAVKGWLPEAAGSTGQEP